MRINGDLLRLRFRAALLGFRKSGLKKRTQVNPHNQDDQE